MSSGSPRWRKIIFEPRRNSRQAAPTDRISLPSVQRGYHFRESAVESVSNINTIIS